MEFRNPGYNAVGTIDCEINHPRFGWIPHTISADENPELQASALAANPAPYTAPDPTVTLAAERANMKCTPMQGILALGEANWQKVVDFRDGTGEWVEQGPAIWSQRVIIDSAQTWVRNSQNIAFFQYLLAFTDEQVDDLFRLAMTIDA